jgi:23S rRNA pseudouridine1911/1915/1917 synthase
LQTLKPEIINETADFFVINKPPGMAVEQPSHNQTLIDWLIGQGRLEPKKWGSATRIGVVHRLDSDTSGIVVVAKNPQSQAELTKLWQARKVEKTYLALVVGEIPKSGTIELPIKRDNKKDRQVVDLLESDKSRAAITTYKKLATSDLDSKKMALVEVKPITGRTHQIRVHLKAIGHPIIGDELYGEKSSRGCAKTLGLTRQFLHAWKLKLPSHPEFTAVLAEDLSQALKKLHTNNPTG